MSNILNRSNHPVEIKRVDLRIWKLRDEIETAIEQRINESESNDPQNIDISDIKEFYTNALTPKSETDEPQENTEEDSNVDSSGNPMDDDAMAMMAALGGGDDKEASDDEQPQDKNSESEEKEDDGAAAMAAQMLADQGIGEAEQSVKDESEPEDTKQKTPKKFVRILPSEDKIINGFVFLSDVQMDQIMLFSKHNFIHGQNIVITFNVTKPFSVTAEVSATTNIARNSRIISNAKAEYRIQCVFKFQFPGERAKLREFLQSVEPDIPDPPKKLKKPDSDDDDDFDDLGF